MWSAQAVTRVGVTCIAHVVVAKTVFKFVVLKVLSWGEVGHARACSRTSGKCGHGVVGCIRMKDRLLRLAREGKRVPAPMRTKSKHLVRIAWCAPLRPERVLSGEHTTNTTHSTTD